MKKLRMLIIICILMYIVTILTINSFAAPSIEQEEPGGPIAITGEMSARESAIWDLLELNFIMAVSDIEDIFRLEDDIHQFDDYSDEAVRQLESIVRSYVEYHMTNTLVLITEEELNDLKQ